MKFTKMQATGNDFVVVDAGESEQSWPALARAMCRRRFGVGADGLILLLSSERAHFRMREFNPDGSEAEACGNGLLCSVRYVIDKGLTKQSEITVETLGGIRGTEAKSDSVKVAMGIPEFSPNRIPVNLNDQEPPVLNYPIQLNKGQIKATFVSMGNPHAVSFVSGAVDDFPLSEVGPQIERHTIFPKRANFEIVKVVGKGKLKARVWERSVGETLSCGSGACAIAVAARLQGLVDNEVEIELPGGILTLKWDGKGEVWLSGHAEKIFEGEGRV